MPNLYFRNVPTGRRYKVLGLDKARGVIILQGPNAKFEEPYDKARFERLGYVLEKETDDAVE